MPNLGNCHLALFLTRGMSLREWDTIGSFDREVALYRALRPHLRALSIISYGDARELSYQDRLQGIRIVCNHFQLPEPWYIRTLYHIYPRLWKRPVLLKSNQTMGAEIPIRIGQHYHLPVIVRSGYLASAHTAIEYGNHSPESVHAFTNEREVYGQADGIIVTTEAIRDEAVQLHAVLPERFHIVPNFVDTDKFCPTHEPQENMMIASVGRLAEVKNHLALIEAMAGSGMRLELVGQGPLRKVLEQAAAQYGVPLVIHDRIEQNELPAFLNRAGAFVLPSFYEGHPKVLIEAMACGLPVIGASVPGIKNLITHEKTGLLCGTDVASIRAAVLRLRDEPTLREHLGTEARAYAETLGLEHILARELAVYAAVLQNHEDKKHEE